MASKHQSSLKTPVSAFSKVLKLSSMKEQKKEQKNNANIRKVFSRKPLNTSQNSSRILSSRLKTQEEEQNYPENPDSMNNSIGTLLNQSKTIKFVSTKSSKSLEKLFVNSSAQHLPTLSRLGSTKQVLYNEKVYKLNSKNNKLNQSPKYSEDYKLGCCQLDIIYVMEKEDYNSKGNLGSTEFSSDENICNQDPNEDDFKNHQLQRSKRNQTFSFYYPKDKKNIHKECPSCLINSQKINELEQANKKLQDTLETKQSEIRKLNLKIQKLSRTLKQNETFRANLEYQIKILKQKQTFINSQKDEVDSAFKKLQSGLAKLSQEIKYKDLELSIHKIYKKKSQEMEMKVETLKNQLNRAKINVNKLMTSKSSQSLRDKNLKLNLTNLGDFKRHNSQKRLKQPKIKQPKIARVYSQDSVFSLSQSQCD